MGIKEWLGERECDTFTLGSELFWVEVANHAAYRILIPQPGVELASLTSPALAGGFFTTCTTWETPCIALSKDKYLGGK